MKNNWILNLYMDYLRGRGTALILVVMLSINGLIWHSSKSSVLVLISVAEQINNKHACPDTNRNISDVKGRPKEALAGYTELKKINNLAQIESVNEIPDSTAE